MPYHPLDHHSAARYVKAAGLFPKASALNVTEIGDGNINMVFRLQDKHNGHSVILKHAFPYVRCVGKSWPLTLDRIRIEADALEIQHRYVPGLVPRILHRNNEMALVVMEDLGRMEVMRKGMNKLRKYGRFAEHISTFMANVLFFTSDLFLAAREKKALSGRFDNPLCQITEDLIFTEPYFDCARNKVNPALRPYCERVFWRKSALRLEAAKLKEKFLTQGQCLIHGDLHTGSILANATETKVFDSEFAFVGPAAFDPGLLVGNFFINFLSLNGKEFSRAEKRAYQRYVLESVRKIYQLFERKFRRNWDQHCKEPAFVVPGFQDYYLRQMFEDTLGFAATEMIRRTHGLAHNSDVDEIEDLTRRGDVQIAILETAEEIMLRRKEFRRMDEVVALVEQRGFSAEGQRPRKNRN
ncbi:MAG: S-methyl-5-thioribose kinase [Methylococcaceae bacterium]|nr:S-methyl-5-thioribose kinase [Methylococcaceae bacterium]